MVEPPTQLIAQGELRVLVEASREDTRYAHVIHRPRAPTLPPRVNKPSAMRGLLWLGALAVAGRELVLWLF